MSKKREFKPWLIAGVILLLPLLLWARSSAPPTGRTGAPGESTCTGCHSNSTATGNVTITFPNGTSYTPGTTQRITIKVTDSTARRWGYEVTAVQASATSTGAGTFSTPDTFSGIQTANSKSYGGHTSAGTFAGTATSATWQLDWIPPATNVGNVVFYIAGLGANNDGGSGGDHTFTANYTLTPAATAPSITATPTSVSFTFTQGGSNPAAQTVAIASTGTALSYTASTTTAWLSISSPTGTTPGNISVSANPSGLAPGTYNGTISVAATGAANTPLSIPVSLTVSAPPNLGANPTSLTFAGQVGGAAPAAQTVAVSSSGSALSYTVTDNATWLTVTPTSGTTPGSLSVTANQSGLAAGTYTANVTIAASGAGNSPLNVPVTFNVTSTPVLGVTPTSLSFSYQIGSANPAAQTLALSSSGAALSFTTSKSAATWLTVTPASGTTPANASVSVNPSGLTAGTYTGTVTITATGASNSPVNVPVTLTVTNAPLPNMSVTPASLTFAYQTGGNNPAAQNVSVGSSGATFNFTTSSSAAWLSATPSGTANQTTPATVAIGVNPSGLAVGSYTGTVTVTSTGAANSPQTVAVTLNVTSPPSLTLSPSSLSFAYSIGGTNPTAQAISIGSTGGSLSYTASASAAWLSVSPASGSSGGSVNVSVNTSGMTAGTYNGSVTITATGAANSPQTVPVTLTVAAANSLLLTASPGTLTYSYAVGAASPATQRINIGSNGASADFRAMVNQPWLQITGASGPTPGYIDVGVIPDGMAAGTYSGAVTLMSGMAANTPLSIPVTLTVSNATLSVTPGTLSFSYRIGGTAPASQTVTVGSTNATSYTATSSAAWLTASPGTGSAPGNMTVGVNTTGMSAGNYTGSITIAASGASNSPQTVSVSLSVTSATGGSITAAPGALTFFYRPGDAAPAAQSVALSSSAATAFTAAAAGGSWLSATPTSGTTNASVSVSVNTTGMPSGTYSGLINVTPSGGTAFAVPVALIISSGQTSTNGMKLDAVPYTQDTTGTAGVSAAWVNGAGISAPGDSAQALVLVKNGASSTSGQAGAQIPGAAGFALNELGFDIRTGQCTSSGPHFAVITSDSVAHVLACGSGVVQASPAAGWIRVRFDLSKALPAITPGATINSLSLVLSAGPDSNSGFAVVDNIDVNGNLISKP